MANTAETPIFCFGDMRKRHIANIGSNKIKESEMTLTAPVAKYAAWRSIQWPPLISWFQALSRGMHSNIVTRKAIM